MSVFADLVAAELDRARRLHGPCRSLHEGYSVILEELDEFWDEVRKRRELRIPERCIAELVQVAAMCQKVAEDVLDAEGRARAFPDCRLPTHAHQ